jgi:hypothetical protein
VGVKVEWATGDAKYTLTLQPHAVTFTHTSLNPREELKSFRIINNNNEPFSRADIEKHIEERHAHALYEKLAPAWKDKTSDVHRTATSSRYDAPLWHFLTELQRFVREACPNAPTRAGKRR